MTNDDGSRTIHRRVWFERKGIAKKLTTALPSEKTQEQRPLRLTKLMALVIRYQQLIDEGHVANRAELGQLAEVSRARLTQIMNLLLLAPDIQEEILFLPLTDKAQEPISDRDMRPVVAELDWEKQRLLWKRILEIRY